MIDSVQVIYDTDSKKVILEKIYKATYIIDMRDNPNKLPLESIIADNTKKKKRVKPRIKFRIFKRRSDYV